MSRKADSGGPGSGPATKPTAGFDPQAIVILGAAVWPGGRPSPTLARRIARGLAAHRAHPDALIIPSGGLGRYGPSEAQVMAQALIAAGVDPGRILLERRSRSTHENLRFTRVLLRARGLTRLLIVTDGYHMPRARLTAWALGITAASAPVPWQAGMSRRRLGRAWAREALALPAYGLRLVWRYGRG